MQFTASKDRRNRRQPIPKDCRQRQRQECGGKVGRIWGRDGLCFIYCLPGDEREASCGWWEKVTIIQHQHSLSQPPDAVTSTPSTYSVCISVSLDLVSIQNSSRYLQWVTTTLYYPLLSFQTSSNLPHRANLQKCPSLSSRNSPPLLLVTAQSMKRAGPTWSAAQLLVAQRSAE